jgi:hypothetical protein
MKSLKKSVALPNLDEQTALLCDLLKLDPEKAQGILSAKDTYNRLKNEFTKAVASFNDRRDTRVISDFGEGQMKNLDAADWEFGQIESLDTSSFYTRLVRGGVDPEFRNEVQDFLYWMGSIHEDEHKPWLKLGFIVTEHLKKFWSQNIPVANIPYDHESNLKSLVEECPDLITTAFHTELPPDYKDAYEIAPLPTRKALILKTLEIIRAGQMPPTHQFGLMLFIDYALEAPANHPEMTAAYKTGELNSFIIETLSLVLSVDSPQRQNFSWVWVRRFIPLWVQYLKSLQPEMDPNSPVFEVLFSIYGRKNNLPQILKTYRRQLLDSQAKKKKWRTGVDSRRKKTRHEVKAATDEGDTSDSDKQTQPPASETKETLAPAFFEKPANVEFLVAEDISTLTIDAVNHLENGAVQIYAANVSNSGKRTNAKPVEASAGTIDLTALKQNRGEVLEIIVFITNHQAPNSSQVLALTDKQKTSYRLNILALEREKAERDLCASIAHEAQEAENWALIEMAAQDASSYQVEYGDDTCTELIIRFSDSFWDDSGLVPNQDLTLSIQFSRTPNGDIFINQFFGVADYKPQDAAELLSFLHKEATKLEEMKALPLLGELNQKVPDAANHLDLLLSSPRLSLNMAQYWHESLQGDVGTEILAGFKTHLSPTYTFEFSPNPEEAEELTVSHESGQVLTINCAIDNPASLFNVTMANITDPRLRVVMAELGKMLLASLAYNALPETEKSELEAEAEKQKSIKDDAIKALNNGQGSTLAHRFGKPDGPQGWRTAIESDEKVLLRRSSLRIEHNQGNIGFSAAAYTKLRNEAMKSPNFQQYLWRRLINTYAKQATQTVPSTSRKVALIDNSVLKAAISVGARKVFTQEQRALILAGEMRTSDLLGHTNDVTGENENTLKQLIDFMEARKIGILVAEDLTISARELYLYAQRNELEIND